MVRHHCHRLIQVLSPVAVLLFLVVALVVVLLSLVVVLLSLVRRVAMGFLSLVETKYRSLITEHHSLEDLHALSLMVDTAHRLHRLRMLVDTMLRLDLLHMVAVDITLLLDLLQDSRVLVGMEVSILLDSLEQIRALRSRLSSRAVIPLIRMEVEVVGGEAKNIG